jgi:hypothetical protein
MNLPKMEWWMTMKPKQHLEQSMLEEEIREALNAH